MSDLQSGQAEAAKVIEATYSYLFQIHAMMEPMKATARWAPERYDMWRPPQNGEVALDARRAVSVADRQA